MKKKFLSFLCMLGITIASMAQSTTPADVQMQRAAILEQVTKAAKEVGVDDKRTAKLKAVFENLFKKQDEIKADTSLANAAKQEKLKAANGDKDWKVQNILGDDLKAYAEVRKRLMAESKKP